MNTDPTDTLPPPQLNPKFKTAKSNTSNGKLDSRIGSSNSDSTGCSSSNNNNSDSGSKRSGSIGGKNSAVNSKDHVKYSRSCSVILIPSRQEYRDAGINLWWSRSDQMTAQTQVKTELKTLLDFNPILSIRAGMKYLYQPKTSDRISSPTASVSATAKEPFTVIIIDSDMDSNSRTYDSVLKGLRNQEKLEVDCKAIYSAEVALQTVKDHPYVDVVLIDESACCGQGFDICRLKTMLKEFNKKPSTLYGVLIENNEECEHKRHDAVEDGFDFIWPKPIASSVDMLPIMISEARENALTGRTSAGVGGKRNQSEVFGKALKRDSLG